MEWNIGWTVPKFEISLYSLSLTRDFSNEVLFYNTFLKGLTVTLA